MASEHEHTTWRYVRVEEAPPDYFYARCLTCNVLARRKAETQTWEMLEDKPTYRQLEQQLAQAKVLLQRVRDKEQAKQELQGFSIFRAPNTLLDDIRAFLAEQKGAGNNE